MQGGKLKFGLSEASALRNVVAMRQKREADPEYAAEQYRNNGKALYERNVVNYKPASANAPQTLSAFNYQLGCLKADIETYGMPVEEFIASIDIDAITTSTSATSADQSQQDLLMEAKAALHKNTRRAAVTEMKHQAEEASDLSKKQALQNATVLAQAQQYTIITKEGEKAGTHSFKVSLKTSNSPQD
jgi:hypothetical protein